MVWEERVMQVIPAIFLPRCGTVWRLAQRHRLFIVSNCQRGYIEPFWKKGNLGNLDSGPCLLRAKPACAKGRPFAF